MIDIGTFKESSLVLMYSLTPIHAGTGRGGGIVDMPVQRDLQGFPVIFSSSLKGPIKSTAFLKAGNRMEKKALEYLMGPELEGETETFSSSFAVLDAKLLAIPARSLRGIYAYVTSPYLLKNFKEYCEISGKKDLIKKVDEIITSIREKFEAITSKNSFSKVSVKINNDYKIILNEDYWLKLEEESNKKIEEFINQLGIEDLISRGLIIVSDEYIDEIVEKSLMRVTRIRIDRDRKTVQKGGLWTEEYVPNKSIFYTVFLYSEPRVTDNKLNEIKKILGKESIDANAVKDFIEKKLFINDLTEREEGKKKVKEGFLVIGGNETIGRGIVKLYII